MVVAQAAETIKKRFLPEAALAAAVSNGLAADPACACHAGHALVNRALAALVGPPGVTGESVRKVARCTWPRAGQGASRLIVYILRGTWFTAQSVA